jgi:hypothetical protein
MVEPDLPLPNHLDDWAHVHTSLSTPIVHAASVVRKAYPDDAPCGRCNVANHCNLDCNFQKWRRAIDVHTARHCNSVLTRELTKLRAENGHLKATLRQHGIMVLRPSSGAGHSH